MASICIMYDIRVCDYIVDVFHCISLSLSLFLSIVVPFIFLQMI